MSLTEQGEGFGLRGRGERKEGERRGGEGGEGKRRERRGKGEKGRGEGKGQKVPDGVTTSKLTVNAVMVINIILLSLPLH